MKLDWYKTLPDGYQAMLGLEKVVHKTKIDHKLLELMKIRASQINGCAHCLDMHIKDAFARGEDALRINVLAAWREAPIYSEKEMAALAWCESLTKISTDGAPEDQYEELQKHFSNEEIVELILAIVAINGWNRLAVAFKSDVGNYVSKIKAEK